MTEVPSPSEDPWRLRASDSDREAYVAVLQHAYAEGRLARHEYDERMGLALQAATYADLAPLVADLPVPPGALPTPPRTVAGVPAVRNDAISPTGLRVDTSPAIAAFSSVKRDGRWALPAEQVSVAVFGTVELDLRGAMLASTTTEIKASAIFGTVEITVPDDIAVDVTGIGIFGEYKRENLGTDGPVAAAASITVTGVALFGQVRVKVVPRPVTGTDRLLDPQPPPPPGIEPPPKP